MSEESKRLIIHILQCKDINMQKVLFGYYKPQLSEDQIKFVENRLGIKKIDPSIKEFVEKTPGWKLINDDE
jgi:hypothetical protein